MAFQYTEDDFINTASTWEDGNIQLSKFDRALRSGWDERMQDGHFRFSLDGVKTRIVPGRFGFVTTLNPKRATDRRKPQIITSVNQPFNPDQFNFTKVRPQELLFNICPPAASGDHVPHENGIAEKKSDKEEMREPRHMLIINVSPLEYGNSLLVPNVDSQLPQVLTYDGVRLAVHLVLMSSHPGFRIGFNSLCAYASVNHQHVHSWYMEHPIYVEHVDTQQVYGDLYELVDVPVPGLALQLHGNSTERLVRQVIKITTYFQQNEIAHNLFMTRGVVFGEDRASKKRTLRVILWIRQKFLGQKEPCEENVAVAEYCGLISLRGSTADCGQEDVFNTAAAEAAGFVPVVRAVEEQFDSITEEEILKSLRKSALPEEEFNKIKKDCIQLMKQ